MKCRAAARMCIVVTLLLIPAPGRGDDVSEVKAMFDEDIRLFNTENKNAFVGGAHDDVVVFGILSPFATKGKEDFRKLVAGYFDDHASVNFKPVNPEFVVTGSSALAWGSYSITEHPKIGPRETIHGRYTFTYTKTDGKWQLVALHLSPLQGY